MATARVCYFYVMMTVDSISLSSESKRKCTCNSPRRSSKKKWFSTKWVHFSIATRFQVRLCAVHSVSVLVLGTETKSPKGTKIWNCRHLAVSQLLQAQQTFSSVAHVSYQHLECVAYFNIFSQIFSPTKICIASRRKRVQPVHRAPMILSSGAHTSYAKFKKAWRPIN